MERDNIASIHNNATVTHLSNAGIKAGETKKPGQHNSHVTIVQKLRKAILNGRKEYIS